MNDHEPAPEIRQDSHLDDETLSTYLDHELAPGRALVEAEQHLEACDRCSGRLDQLQGASGALRALGAERAPVRASARASAIAQAIDQMHVSALPGARERRQRRRRLALASGWAAALLVLAGTAGALLRYGPHGTTGSSTAQSGLGADRPGSAAPSGAGGTSAKAPAPAPVLQLRRQIGAPFPGCAGPVANRSPRPALGATLYDAPASASAGAPRCVRVGPAASSATSVRKVRVVPGADLHKSTISLLPTPGYSYAALPVPNGASAGPLLAVVGGQAVGQVSATAFSTALSSGRLTITGVPAQIAESVAGDLRRQ